MCSNLQTLLTMRNRDLGKERERENRPWKRIIIMYRGRRKRQTDIGKLKR